MPRGVYPEAPEWSADEDEMLCLLRSDFPVETFETIAHKISAMFGISRTRCACIARWHRIETEDELEVRKAMAHAAIREAAKQAILDPPPPPVAPPMTYGEVKQALDQSSTERSRRWRAKQVVDKAATEKAANLHYREATKRNRLIGLPSGERMLRVGNHFGHAAV